MPDRPDREAGSNASRTDELDLTGEDDSADESPGESVDFTGEAVGEGEVEELRRVRYDPGEDRERIRGQLALGILLILGGIVAGAFLTVWLDWGTREDLDLILTAMLTPIVGLFGAVSGFYYGSRAGR